MTYLALLRGINVGGNNKIPMATLRVCLEKVGLKNVRTYIQSGNIFFESNESDNVKLEQFVSKAIEDTFEMVISVVVFKQKEWESIIGTAPHWWGKDSLWKHNILVMVRPYSMSDVVEAYGKLKPEIERMKPGNGVLYQSIMFVRFGQTTGGKLASNPIYKQMTVRNFNTATKLAQMF